MKRVVIIGVSYAGLYAIKELSKNKDIEILLFDKKTEHYMQVESYGFVATKYSIFDVTISIEKYIKTLNSNVKFFNEEISSFDSSSKEIKSFNNKKYRYDYLVIATGSLTNFPIQVPNIQKYSIGIKTLQKASKINQIFDSILSKVFLDKKNINSKSYNIVIGGAGLSGVEVAAEMAVLIKEKFSFLNDESSNINIFIIDGMKTVLPNMDDRLVSACNKRLESLNIKTYLGSFISDVDEKKIYLSDKTIIDYDCFIFTGGIKGVTINSPKTYEVNKLNQYKVNENLQLKGENNVFVVGDAAEVILNGKYIPPTAQLAIQGGKYVASFICNELKYKYTHSFIPKSNGILISLGGSYAIGLVYNKLFIEGYLAHILKYFVTYLHKIKFTVK